MRQVSQGIFMKKLIWFFMSGKALRDRDPLGLCLTGGPYWGPYSHWAYLLFQSLGLTSTYIGILPWYQCLVWVHARPYSKGPPLLVHIFIFHRSWSR